MKFLAKHLHAQKDSGSSPSRSLIKRIGRDPYVDWTIIFAVVLVMAVALIVSGWAVYIGVGDESRAPMPAPKSQAPIIDVKALGQILGEFETRAGLRSALLKGYEGPADPAL